MDTSQLKKIDDYENISSVNLLYLMIYRATGHLKEKNESKYLVLSSDNELMDKRLKTRLKELTVVKNLNMAKIL